MIETKRPWRVVITTEYLPYKDEFIGLVYETGDSIKIIYNGLLESEFFYTEEEAKNEAQIKWNEYCFKTPAK